MFLAENKHQNSYQQLTFKNKSQIKIKKLKSAHPKQNFFNYATVLFYKSQKIVLKSFSCFVS